MSQAELLPSAPCPFSFKNHEIRTIQEDDGALWFAAKDVCAALGIVWNGKVLSGIPADWQGMRSFLTPSGNQRLRALQEPGVYKLAFRSNKEEADEFTNWIASDVVPSIRKTGQYTAKPQAPALDTTSRLSKRTDPERKELTAMINAWVGCAPIHYAGARSMINAHFGVKGVDDMTVEQVKAAIGFVQAKIDALPKALPEAAPEPEQSNVYFHNSPEFILRELEKKHEQAVERCNELSRWAWVMEREINRLATPLYREIMRKKLGADVALSNAGVEAMSAPVYAGSERIVGAMEEFVAAVRQAAIFAKAMRGSAQLEGRAHLSLAR